MGVNTRTYKFALGKALLDLAAEGHEDISLLELANRYALLMAARADGHNQAPAVGSRSETDYLTVLDEERAATLAAGVPTERLLEATTSSIPAMVMTKFHNLRGFDNHQIPHRFYHLDGRGTHRRVILTPELHVVADSGRRDPLATELNARWDLVECSFDAKIGRSLISSGVIFETRNELLLEPVRRTSVTSARPALEGFQHGRCFICHEPLQPGDEAHVDHVYPFSLMKRSDWSGTDLNGVWNLVVTHAACNLDKLARMPTPDEVGRLIERNLAILDSPHPLKRSIQIATGAAPGPNAAAQLRSFFTRVDAAAHLEYPDQPR